MEWVLIYWMWVGGGAITGQAQFANEEACKSAFHKMGETNRGSNISMWGVCVPNK